MLQMEARPAMLHIQIINAAKRGDTEVIRQYLLSGKALEPDSCAPGPEGNTLLHLVLGGCGPRVERSDLCRLLASVVDVNASNAQGTFPLHLARYPEEAAVLLDNGADVNASCDDVQVLFDETPLELNYDNPPLARLLLSRGARTHPGKRDLTQFFRDMADDAAREPPVYDFDPGSMDKQGYICYGDYARRDACLEAARLLEAVDSAGGWRRYTRAPRVELVRLRLLCDRGRATPPSAASAKLRTLTETIILERLFGTRTSSTRGGASGRVPNEVFWLIFGFWRSSRDCPYYA